LPALHYLQDQYGHLPDWGMEVVGWHLGIPASEVYGAATSYSELRVDKAGEHLVRVCTALSCWLNGGRELLGALQDELGVHPGSTTGDGRFTLEEAPCGFLCGLAPAVELDGAWHGRMAPDLVQGLIARADGP
jgi:NADH:ubiquinone oxidoreductase subunit E